MKCLSASGQDLETETNIFSFSSPSPPPAPADWEEAVHNRLILIDISNHCPPPLLLLLSPHTPHHHLPCVSDSLPPASQPQRMKSGQLIPSLGLTGNIMGRKVATSLTEREIKNINLTQPRLLTTYGLETASQLKI